MSGAVGQPLLCDLPAWQRPSPLRRGGECERVKFVGFGGASGIACYVCMNEFLRADRPGGTGPTRKAVGRLSWRDQGPQAEGTIQVRFFRKRRGDLGCAFFCWPNLAGARHEFHTADEMESPMSTNVLVADDSGTMRKIIIRSLNAVGIQSVVEAADGEQAVALFRPGTFDLVLTDWNMPGKTGLQVIQAIRAQDAKVPIIMITTEAEKRRVLEAVQAGVTDYLVKPFTPDTLREKLDKHVAVVS